MHEAVRMAGKSVPLDIAFFELLSLSEPRLRDDLKAIQLM
jgi:hypothetical protein